MPNIDGTPHGTYDYEADRTLSKNTPRQLKVADEDDPTGFENDAFDGRVSPLKPKTANDIQHGGTHYKGKAIQPWDYIIANNMGFLDGTAIKYITRYKEKNGVEDLRKAIHFIEKLIEVETQNERN